MDRLLSRRTVVGAMAGGAAVAAAGLTRFEGVSAAGGAPVQKGKLMAQGTPSAEATPGAAPTVVLVHGAFADASGWAGVITRLQAAGIPVIAPANPLRAFRPTRPTLHRLRTRSAARCCWLATPTGVV